MSGFAVALAICFHSCSGFRIAFAGTSRFPEINAFAFQPPAELFGRIADTETIQRRSMAQRDNRHNESYLACTTAQPALRAVGR
jgi:hypothetical protein